MRIKKLVVEKLFGVFDHEISLNMDEGITIIHGPNGFGKTAILRILSNFFNKQYTELQQTAFARFSITFDNDSRIDISRRKESIENFFDLAFQFYGTDGEKSFFSPVEKTHEGDNRSTYSARPEFEYIGQDRWVKIHRSKALTFQEAARSYFSSTENTSPAWLQEIRNNISVKFIQSQRLLDFLPENRSRNSPNRPPMMTTVAAYSDEIAELMRDKFKEYGTISQSLDGSFPIRILQQEHFVEVTEEQLLKQLSEIENTRARLIEVGILDPAESSALTIQPQKIDETTKMTLSIYIEDAQKKLSVFSDISDKIDLLRRIINRKFAYSKKELKFSRETGFVFETHYQPLGSDSKQISANDLSSGEQHELVLLYELLFKVEPSSLVLIDEPELSLHVSWQSQFIQDLQEIMKLTNISVLIATHSPDIIQDRWDLTVSLADEAELEAAE